MINESNIKRQEILDNLKDYDACFMTGPTSIMHFVRLPFMSVPITNNSMDDYPRSVIFYAKNEEILLSFARILDNIKDAINKTRYYNL